jgi:hypothetical protein
MEAPGSYLSNNEFTTDKIKNVIISLLSYYNDNDKNKIFDRLLDEIQKYHSREAHTLNELKDRDNKKIKGDIWERFCVLYLENLEAYYKNNNNINKKYINVWLWKDVPNNVLSALGLKITKVDNGIDIIAETYDNKYHAIQCKYLGNTDKTVSWATLSTFVGLCARSGPWDRQIVMTTGKGITRKVPKTDKDLSICIGTFRGLSKEMWMKISGIYTEHRINDPIDNINNINKIDFSNLNLSNLNTKPSTINELRDKRLQYYQNK